MRGRISGLVKCQNKRRSGGRIDPPGKARFRQQFFGLFKIVSAPGIDEFFIVPRHARRNGGMGTEQLAVGMDDPGPDIVRKTQCLTEFFIFAQQRIVAVETDVSNFKRRCAQQADVPFFQRRGQVAARHQISIVFADGVVIDVALQKKQPRRDRLLDGVKNYFIRQGQGTVPVGNVLGFSKKFPAEILVAFQMKFVVPAIVFDFERSGTDRESILFEF